MVIFLLSLSHFCCVQHESETRKPPREGVLIWQKDLNHQLGEKLTETFREISGLSGFLQDLFYSLPVLNLHSSLGLPCGNHGNSQSDLQFQTVSLAAHSEIHHFLGAEAVLPTAASR